MMTKPAWTGYHLHAFKLHGRRYGTRWTGARHRDKTGREITLAHLRLRVRLRILYEHDFGDPWEHEIRVEARLEGESGKAYPICIDGARAGPPEDIGGPSGYHALFDRLLSEGDEEVSEDDDPLHAFEPERFIRREVNAELKRELAGTDEHAEG